MNKKHCNCLINEYIAWKMVNIVMFIYLQGLPRQESQQTVIKFFVRGFRVSVFSISSTLQNVGITVMILDF